MSSDLVLQRAAVAAAALREGTELEVAGQVQQVVALVELAESYRVSAADAERAGERLVGCGGDGTPLVSEFLALEVAGLLGVSSRSAALRVARALDLRYRHPELFSAVVAGQVRVWQANAVTTATAGLSVAAAGWVDRQAAMTIPVQPWGRVERSLPGWVAAADPAVAAARAERARGLREFRVGRFTDGHVPVWGRLDPADAVALDAALDRVAEDMATAGHSGDLQQRRAAALGILARGESAGGPVAATVVVHMTAETILGDDGSGVARVEGWGPLERGPVREFLSGCTTVRVLPLLDPTALPPVDAYEVPPRMRFALQQRNPVDVFPFGAVPATTCDADHTIPYRHDGTPGQTRLGNLGPLARRAHRAKTFGHWQVTQPEPGCFEWRSPLGFEYRVTPDGTTRITRPPPRPSRPVDGPSDRHILEIAELEELDDAETAALLRLAA